MDFGKVKTLLIVVFLILNMFLFGQWWTLQTSVGMYQEPYADELANVTRSLAEHHVRLQAIVPNIQPTLSILSVTPPRDPFAIIAAKALQVSVNQVRARGKSGQRVHLPQATFMQTSPTTMQLYLSPYAQPVLQSRLPIVDQIKRWVSLRAYHFNEYKFIGWHSLNQGTQAVFQEQFQGNPLILAQLLVDIKYGHIIGYTQTYLNIKGVIDPRPVISAANALLSVSLFMDKAHINEDNTIRDVLLGYSTQVQVHDIGYLTPVWWIETDLGDFVVNAFTGEVGVEND
ncbi:two-component system regulatory protein YycI [Sulfoacidibacillus thermotolerans]|uniref:Regulatory protein YycH-like domain-containing protein n=1 Tax=Sulfoacidibacillus thermotolerans TaxID=1765684 RepID=A0A2U3D9G8_SULT2|nr:two-component system regulatory protein YycI [Sulfoacidibacillus thermotolerans]PWI57930.1 hypothetical protein BM613_05825 [Sulfoacidibacillus thermotolerans]